MSRNSSILLVGAFCLVALIFGNVFWQMFAHGNNEAFEKIKKETDANLAKKQIAAATSPASGAPSALGASTNTVPENNSSESGAAQSLPQKDADPQAAESEETPDSTTEKPKDDTEDWKTYTDEKNKFEFKYPSDAQIVHGGDLVRVSQNDKTWKLRAYSDKDKLDLQSWYNKEFSEKERKNCTLTESTLKVGSYETKYVNPNSGQTECEKPGYYSISSTKERVVRVELGDETMDNVNKILKTFIFQ
ncbi:MAG: hypothetical protein WAV73_03660 [Candidatus Moraniibacteriota bacterium]